MIYLKAKNSGQVKECKDGDMSTVEDLLSTGNWIRVQGRKDPSAYSPPKKSSKKKSE
jgi:hypothetical protein|tara:strand:- start:881 stop:1051 length:171 start_codon:yes stop_codon:yes gene_type:complete